MKAARAALLRRLARQLRRWSYRAAVLAGDGGVPAHAMEDRSANSASPAGGPPAEWLEHVRRYAPGYAQELVLGTASPAVVPSAPPHPGASDSWTPAAEDRPSAPPEPERSPDDDGPGPITRRPDVVERSEEPTVPAPVVRRASSDIDERSMAPTPLRPETTQRSTTVPAEPQPLAPHPPVPSAERGSDDPPGSEARDPETQADARPLEHAGLVRGHPERRLPASAPLPWDSGRARRPAAAVRSARWVEPTTRRTASSPALEPHVPELGRAPRPLEAPAPPVHAVRDPEPSPQGLERGVEDQWPELVLPAPPPAENVLNALRRWERSKVLLDEQVGTRWNA